MNLLEDLSVLRSLASVGSAIGSPAAVLISVESETGWFACHDSKMRFWDLEEQIISYWQAQKSVESSTIIYIYFFRSCMYTFTKGWFLLTFHSWQPEVQKGRQNLHRWRSRQLACSHIRLNKLVSTFVSTPITSVCAVSPLNRLNEDWNIISIHERDIVVILKRSRNRN